MSVAPQADTETVTGIVQGIVHKGEDKYQVEVNVGQQNPRRLWTKDATVVQQLMGLIGQQLSFMCGVSHWTRTDGTPVRSLWVNGFGQPGSMPHSVAVQQPPVPVQPVQSMVQQAQPLPVPAQTLPVVPTTVRVDNTEDKIHRQTATKVAVHLLKHLKPEDQTFTNLIALSERLVAYYDAGVAWPQDAPEDDGAPPHTDDDIPF